MNREKIIYYLYEAVQSRYSDARIGLYLNPKDRKELVERKEELFKFLRELNK